MYNYLYRTGARSSPVRYRQISESYTPCCRQVSPAAAEAAGQLLRSHANLQVLGLRRCLTGVEGMIALTSGAICGDYRSASSGTLSHHQFLWRAASLRLELQQSRLGGSGSIPLANALSQAERHRIQAAAQSGPTNSAIYGDADTELDLELG